MPEWPRTAAQRADPREGGRSEGRWPGDSAVLVVVLRVECTAERIEDAGDRAVGEAGIVAQAVELLPALGESIPQRDALVVGLVEQRAARLVGHRLRSSDRFLQPTGGGRPGPLDRVLDERVEVGEVALDDGVGETERAEARHE